MSSFLHVMLVLQRFNRSSQLLLRPLQNSTEPIHVANIEGRMVGIERLETKVKGCLLHWGGLGLLGLLGLVGRRLLETQWCHLTCCRHHFSAQDRSHSAPEYGKPNTCRILLCAPEHAPILL